MSHRPGWSRAKGWVGVLSRHQQAPEARERVGRLGRQAGDGGVWAGGVDALELAGRGRSARPGPPAS